MAQGFKSTLIMILVIGLFAFSLINFGVQFAYKNNSNDSIIDYPTINSTLIALGVNLSDTQDTANTQINVLGQNDPTLTSESIILESIQSVWRVLSDMVVGVYNITFGLVFETLFGSSFGVVGSVITAIILVILALYAWKVVRTGDPD